MKVLTVFAGNPVMVNVDLLPYKKYGFVRCVELHWLGDWLLYAQDHYYSWGVFCLN